MLAHKNAPRILSFCEISENRPREGVKTLSVLCSAVINQAIVRVFIIQVKHTQIRVCTKNNHCEA